MRNPELDKQASDLISYHMKIQQLDIGSDHNVQSTGNLYRGLARRERQIDNIKTDNTILRAKNGELNTRKCWR